MLAVAAAIAAPSCLMVSAPVFAAKPTPVCIVGHSHANIKLAIADTSCEFINVPAGTFDESLVIMRDVEIRGAGPDSTIVRGITGAVFSIYSPTNSPTTLPVVTLKGMTMTNGKPRPQGSPRWDGCWGGGGGIEISLSEVTVKDSYITDNVTQTTYCPGSIRGGPLYPFWSGRGNQQF